MATHANQASWEHEQAFLKEERAKHPEDFVAPLRGGTAVNAACGMHHAPSGLPKGYVRYSPLDFVVEEVRADHAVVKVDESTSITVTPSTGNVQADLVKVGVSTVDAALRISQALGRDISVVGYAGIKDGMAVTAQRISLQGVSAVTASALTVPNVWLRNVTDGGDVMKVGMLAGNRFTLFVRTQTPDQGQTAERLAKIGRDGVMNYYGPQRFGAPRYVANQFGLHLLRGDFEAGIRACLCAESPFEWPYAARIRAQMTAVWGDWDAMLAACATLPHTFERERILLTSLTSDKTNPLRFQRALEALGKQYVNLWAQSYSSYLTNELLSAAEQAGSRMPEEIPLLLSLDPNDRAAYRPLLKRDGTERFLDAIKSVRHLVSLSKAPRIQPKLKPVIHGVKANEKGVALSFDLPKGAYATTILMHLFDTDADGTDVPSWLKTEEVDSKALLGTGSLASVTSHFRGEIDAILKSRGEEAE